MRLRRIVLLSAFGLLSASASGVGWAQAAGANAGGTAGKSSSGAPTSPSVGPRSNQSQRHVPSVGGAGTRSVGAGGTRATPSAAPVKLKTNESERKSSGADSAASSRSAASSSNAATVVETGKSIALPARSSIETKPGTPSAKDEKTPGLGEKSVKEGDLSTQSDPELVALERAERDLFPQALRGIRPSFAFETDADWTGTSRSTATSATAPPKDAWYRDLILPQLYPNVDGRILTYLEFYRSQADGKAILRAWAKKRGRYESSIVTTLTKGGLPKDLVWQCLVESALNPTIKSPAGAAGLWQFMPETAKLYGLTVDRWLDERLDPERATVAAARMMSELFERLGNWELALAAYNMGEAGLLRAIRKYNTNDFWTLSRYEAGLPWETALYVPRIIAITIAMNNPQAFGIDDVVADDPVVVDTVVLSAGQPLAAVARAAGVTEAQLSQLNPQLLSGRLPPALGKERGTVRIFVPRGKGEQVRNRLSRASGPEPDLESYAVKRGDTVESIASNRGVSEKIIRSINSIVEGEALEQGTVLLLPRALSAGFEPQGSDDERIAVVPPDVRVAADQRRVFYRVSTGDTLGSIAESFAISRALLLEQNSLDPSAKLQQSMLLQVLLPKDAKPKSASYREEKDFRVLVAGSADFLDYFEGQRGNERVVVQARANDSLASIGARHGVSVGMMERINRRSRRDKLTTGESVVVYVRRAGIQERVGVAQ